MAKHNLLVVDDSVVLTLVNDARYRNLFPCMDNASKRLRTAEASCSTCGRTKQSQLGRVTAESIQSVKNCIAAMPQSQFALLADMLDTRQIRVIRIKPTGLPQTLTRKR